MEIHVKNHYGKKDRFWIESWMYFHMVSLVFYENIKLYGNKCKITMNIWMDLD